MVFITGPNQDPNTVIIDRRTRKVLGRFVEGRFETSDPKMISRMKPHYKVLEQIETSKRGRQAGR